MAKGLELRGQLHVTALVTALRKIVERHEILRTAFQVEGEEPRQVVTPHVDQPVTLVDLQSLSADSLEAASHRLTVAEANRPFDLTRGNLCRVTLIRQAANRHRLLVTLHHIVGDDWSLGIFVRELTDLYQAFLFDKPNPLEPLAIQYGDYSVWQRRWLKGAELAKHLGYWRRCLDGLPPLLPLPLDRPRPQQSSDQGGSHHFTLSADLTNALAACNRRHGTTWYMSLGAIFALWLNRITGSDDIAFGTPVANRTRREVEALIGFFINTLVMRFQKHDDPDFPTWLSRVRKTVLDAFQHQQVPFEYLVEALDPQRQLNHAPLVQVFFTFQNAPKENLQLPGLSLAPVPPGLVPARFDLSLTMAKSESALVGVWKYNLDLFDAATIEAFSQQFITLLTACTAAVERPVSRLPLQNEQTRRQHLEALQMPAVFPNVPLFDLLLPESTELSDRTALTTAIADWQDQQAVQWTRQRLRQQACASAEDLQRAGLKANEVVAIAAERHARFIERCLAVLAAGGAFLPIDRELPLERKRTILMDAGVRLVMGDLDLPASEPWVVLPKINRRSHLKPLTRRVPVNTAGLAYLIYTSGSTGRPKGVAVSHEAANAYTQAVLPRINPPAKSRWAMASSPAADLGLTVVFGALASGGTLLMVDRNTALDGRCFDAALMREQVDILKIVPSHLRALEGEAGENSCLPKKRLILGGEAAPQAWLEALANRALNPEDTTQRAVPQLMNHYGPTETTIGILATDPLPLATFAKTRTLPLGHPLAGVSAYLLDHKMEPVALAETGELYIAGKQLSPGYHNRPAATAAAFLPDPFSKLSGTRCYRTGDMARYDHRHQLHFLGRRDHQVKIRGYRVEPGEVAAVLQTLDAVEQAAVIAFTDSDTPQLVAVVVPSGTNPVRQAALQSILEDRLPPYMVPTRWMIVPRMPLTANGKLDLAAIRSGQYQSTQDAKEGADLDAAPVDPIVGLLKMLWSDLLGHQNISEQGHFFVLGGHSLLATRLLSRIQQVFSIDLPLRTLFQNPILSDMAYAIRQAKQGAETEGLPPIRRVDRNQAMPLSFPQLRLWFIDRLDPGNPLYNVLFLESFPGVLDIGCFGETLYALTARHESLRTTFGESDNQPFQVIGEPYLPLIGLLDLSSLSEDLQARAFARLHFQMVHYRFDLLNGPLFRVFLVRVRHEEHILLGVAHHIVTDAWSRKILREEISEIYAAKLRGHEVRLASLPIQYADFAAWQRQQSETSHFKSQLAYWRKTLTPPCPELTLVSDYRRPAQSTGLGAILHRQLTPAQTAAIADYARASQLTPFMVTIAAYAVLLARWSGQSGLTIGFPVSGRHHQATENLIGFFVNMLVLRVDLGATPSFRDMGSSVRQTLLDAFAHQDIPFESMVEAVSPERRLNQTPLFSVNFTYDESDEQAGTTQMNLDQVSRTAKDPSTTTARPYAIAKYDLSLTTVNHGGGMQFHWTYRTDLFSRDRIAMMADLYMVLLERLIAEPDTPFDRIELRGEHEKKQWLRQMSAPDLDQAHPPVTNMVAAWAQETPDAVALLEPNGQHLTYHRYLAEASALAAELKDYGVDRETPVCVVLPTGRSSAVAMLGILLADGAYVPLDTEAPVDWLAQLIKRVDPSVIVTEPAYMDSLPAMALAFRGLVSPSTVRGRSTVPFASRPRTADQLAYIMFTSGSTGQPKGVAIPHAGISRLVHKPSYVDLSPATVILPAAPIHFDAATFEIWGALANGGRLVWPAQPILEAHVLAMAIRREKVETMWLTTALFNAVVDTDPSALKGLRQLIIGGEALSVNHIYRFQKHCPRTTLVNGYGPTENTTFTSCHPIPTLREPLPSAIPIGRAIGGTQAWIADPRGEAVPAGLVGQLLTSGMGLARGYWQRPAQTAADFRPVHGATAGARCFATGDLAIADQNDVITFWGRMDNQLKLRGFRVEPEGIAHVLSLQEGVGEATVIARDLGEQGPQLIAFITAKSDGVQPDADLLRDILKQQLPNYMVPARIIVLAELPKTRNGKIDRSKLQTLPLPSGKPQGKGLPRTAEERLLLDLWRSVLARPNLGSHDDFFDAGGHSLLATKLTAQIQSALDQEVPLRWVFEYPTVAEFATVLTKQREEQLPPLSPLTGELTGSDAETAPLSFGQERLWFIDQLDPGSPAQNILTAEIMTGPIHIMAMEHAFEDVLVRHQVLRSYFPTIDGEPRQRVRPLTNLHLPVVDLTGLKPAHRKAVRNALVQQEAGHRFDLTTGPLIRIIYIQQATEQAILVVNIHHIVTDAWSAGILRREFSQRYRHHLGQPTESLPKLPLQYADYSRWQRKHLAGPRLAARLELWRRHLGALPDPLTLTIAKPRPAVQNHHGDKFDFAIPTDLAETVRDFARYHQTTPFTVYLAVYVLLLARYSHRDRFWIGIPIAGRDRVEIEHLIGFFVNSLTIPVDLTDHPDVATHLARIREATLFAYAHAEVPFEQLVEAYQPPRTPSHAPLFQVMFNYVAGSDRHTSLSDTVGRHWRESRIDYSWQVSTYEWTLTLLERPDGLGASIIYKTDLFERPQVTRFSQHYLEALTAVIAHPDHGAKSISFLPPSERNRLLNRWHTGSFSSPDQPLKTMSQWFEETVARSPDASVLAFTAPRSEYPGGHAVWPTHRSNPVTLTYTLLNRLADHLARHLIQRGVRPETTVAFLFKPGPDSVVTILAIWKAGGALLPLDPDNPAPRSGAILAEGNATLLIHHPELAPPEGFPGPCLALDPSIVPAQVASKPFSRPAQDPDHLAYVIFTSGSTGTPKGAAITHAGLNPLIHFELNEKTPDRKMRSFQCMSLVFDFGLFELLTALLDERVFVVAPLATRLRPERFHQVAMEQAIDYICCTPTFFRAVIQHQALPSLRLLYFGGEVLHSKDVRRARAHGHPEIQIINGYGPTEASITSSVHWLTDQTVEANDDVIPIGRPTPVHQWYVQDALGQLVPQGVAGELFIGGDLARGYVNRPGLTARQFLPDPFSGVPGERLYRSGDWVRFDEQGNLHFLGRVDHQIKLRGYRVETVEIASVLSSAPDVKEAVVAVVADDRGEQRLTAFVQVLTKAWHVEPFKNFLRHRLPAYMVPDAWVRIDHFPTTATGKIDLRALPSPSSKAMAPAWNEEPQNPIEARLVQLWAQVLGISSAHRALNFFDAGGHSLLAARVVGLISQEWQRDLPMVSIFEHPTPAAFANYLHRGAVGEQAVPPIEPVPRMGFLPLSFAQQRMWFLEKLADEAGLYNIPSVFAIEGPLAPFALAEAIELLVDRHEIMRSCYPEIDGAPHLIIQDAFSAPLQVIDLDGLPEPSRKRTATDLNQREANRVFDMDRGPLVRFRLLRFDAATAWFQVNLHHIIADGWSIGVLLRDLATFYRQSLLKDGPAQRQPLAIQYVDAAFWERQILVDTLFPKQLAYWAKTLDDSPRSLGLTPDKPRQAVQRFRGQRLIFQIDGPLRTDLARLGNENGCTLFMTLLAIYQWTLFQMTRRTDLVVGTPISRRTTPELEPLIGFFVNTLALRLRLQPTGSFLDMLAAIRTTVLDAFLNQDIPFERVVEAIGGDRQLDRHPLFQTMFTLQTGTDRPPDWPGAKLRMVPLDRDLAKFDLALTLVDTPNAIQGVLIYNADLYEQATAQCLVDGFVEAAAMMVERPTVQLLHHLSRQEFHQAETASVSVAQLKPYPVTGLIEPFHQMVCRRPHAVALVDGDTHLSYESVWRSSVDLSHQMTSAGLGVEDLIGVWAQRRWQSVVGFLAVLHAGAAFVPVSPQWPRARLESLAKTISLTGLTAAEDVDLPAPLSALPRWTPTSKDSPTEKRSATPQLVHPRQLAYVMTTSGTTGSPKAIAVSQTAICQRLAWSADALHHGPTDRLLVSSAFSFDISVWEWLAPLWAGGCAVLADPACDGDASKLLDQIARFAITDWHTVPSLLPLLLAQADLSYQTRRLKRFFCGGEALDGETRLRIHQKLAADCYHFYGPTEAAINATACRWTATENQQSNGIGRAIQACSAWIVDPWLFPVPARMEGELCLAGPNLARGYLGDPVRTALAFVPDPFTPHLDRGLAGGRLYRSGDLARRDDAGALIFRGRIDRQIKLRGVRIEPADVEHAIRSLRGVKDTAVLVLNPTSKQAALTAFVVQDEHVIHQSSAALRTAVAKLLPATMTPTRWVTVPDIPVTPHGKRDEVALKRHAANQDQSRPRGGKPRTWVERELIRLWAKVLARDTLGMDDNFFDLGGHSLIATQLISAVQTRFDVSLPLRFLFENPSLAAFSDALTAHLKSSESPDLPPIRRTPREHRMTMSLAQKRMWFTGQMEGKGHTHNIALGVQLLGSLDTSVIEKTLGEIIRRQESLRCYFPIEQGQPALSIRAYRGFQMDLLDLSGLDETVRTQRLLERLRSEVNYPFSLDEGPLFRFVLVRLNPKEHGFIFNFHHIISDGWSVEVFSAEFKSLYAAFVHGHPSPLPELTIQYADFAAWQDANLGGTYRQAMVHYWRHQLADAPTLMYLPWDRPRRRVQRFHGDIHGFPISPETSRAARHIAKTHGITIFMMFHAAFVAFLHRYCGQKDIVVGSPIANRNRGEVEPLIGYFVNPLVLRIKMTAQDTFASLLQRVKATDLEAFRHQDISFEHVVQALSPPRNLDHHPIYQLMFQLQNAPANNVRLPGLEILPLSEKGEVTARLDLTLSINETERQFYGVMQYNRDLFDPDTVARFAKHFSQLTHAITQHPDQPIGRLPLLQESERMAILERTNGGEMSQLSAPVPDLSSSLASSDEPCLSWFTTESNEPIWLTWSAAQVRAHALHTARRLLAAGMTPGSMVEVVSTLPECRALAWIGVWFAGGCVMVKDSADLLNRDNACAIRLADRNHAAQPFDGVTLVINTDFIQDPPTAPTWVIPEQAPACLVPTIDGGSWVTTYGSLWRHLNQGTFADSAGDPCLWLSPTSHAIGFTMGLAACALRSHHLILDNRTPSSGLDSANLPAKPDWLLTTPSIYRLLEQHLETCPAADVLLLHDRGHLRDLAHDSLPTARHAGGRRRLINLHHWMTPLLWWSSNSWQESSAAPEGCIPDKRPTLPSGALTRSYVLDPCLEPLPPGVSGSLWLALNAADDGWSRYPDLAIKHFRPDPFSKQPGGRLFRTGLRAAQDPSGNIHLEGANTDRVALGSFQFSLERIACVLRDHPQVADAQVQSADSPGRGGAIARVVLVESSGAKLLDDYQLMRYLKTKLPPYAVPGTIHIEQTWPLTPRLGTANRSQTVTPTSRSEAENISPRTWLEWELCALFAQTLDREHWSVRDHFFEQGGASIMAVSLIERINRRFGTQLPIRAIYLNTNVEDMAATIIDQRPTSAPDPELICFHEQEQGPALIFIHPEGGELNLYLPLIQHLAPHCAIWGLQQTSSSGDQPASLESLADHYLDLIAEHLSERPVFFLGWSMGETIAREMAARANDRHPKVNLLYFEEPFPQQPITPNVHPGHTFAEVHGLAASVPHEPAPPELAIDAWLRALLTHGREQDLIPPYWTLVDLRSRFEQFLRDRNQCETWRKKPSTLSKGALVLLPVARPKSSQPLTNQIKWPNPLFIKEDIRHLAAMILSYMEEPSFPSESQSSEYTCEEHDL